MKKLLLSLGAVSLSISSLCAIEGTYSFSGYDPYDKQAYTGTVIITKDKNKVYQINWSGVSGPGGSGNIWTAQGTGLKKDNQASFAYKESSGKYGMQNYTVSGDHLEGPFVLLNQNLVGTEKLEKQ